MIFTHWCEQFGKKNGRSTRLSTTKIDLKPITVLRLIIITVMVLRIFDSLPLSVSLSLSLRRLLLPTAYPPFVPISLSVTPWPTFAIHSSVCTLRGRMKKKRGDCVPYICMCRVHNIHMKWDSFFRHSFALCVPLACRLNQKKKKKYDPVWRFPISCFYFQYNICMNLSLFLFLDVCACVKVCVTNICHNIKICEWGAMVATTWNSCWRKTLVARQQEAKMNERFCTERERKRGRASIASWCSCIKHVSKVRVHCTCRATSMQHLQCSDFISSDREMKTQTEMHTVREKKPTAAAVAFSHIFRTYDPLRALSLFVSVCIHKCVVSIADVWTRLADSNFINNTRSQRIDDEEKTTTTMTKNPKCAVNARMSHYGTKYFID